MSLAPDHDMLDVYDTITRTLVPAWLRIVGAAPWWEVATNLRRVVRRPVLLLYRQQASALGLHTALGLTREHDTEHIRTCTRAALIQWQMALDPDGRPASPRWRGSRLWPVVAQQVVRRLDVEGDELTPDALNDLARHLTWLSRRAVEDAPWMQSALMEALAFAAPLVRDSGLLTSARQRLPRLLHQQSAEGWFRERGGADVGRLSLTIDALTRLHLDHGWDELAEPLGRAVTFLSVLVHPNGIAGGCYASCDTGFVSPYAIDRLADSIPQAAHVARILRSRWARVGSQIPTAWNDNLTAFVGSAVASTAAAAAATRGAGPTNLAESYAASERPAPSANGDAHTSANTAASDDVFPDAGLTVLRRPAYTAIVAGQRGGAMQVRWHDADSVAEYPGVTVVFAHTVRTGRGLAAGYQRPTTDGSMSWRGILLRATSRRIGWWRRAWRASLGRWIRRRRGSVAARFQVDTLRGRDRLLHDWFSRDLTFHDDGITIRDQVLCRLPSEAIVLESFLGEDRWLDRVGNDASSAGPIVIEGGRAVSITRVYRNGKLESCRVERHVDLF